MAGAAWLLIQIWPLAAEFLRQPSMAVGDLLIMGFALSFAAGAVNAIYGLLFELFGTEDARIKADHLRLRRTIAGLGHQGSYELRKVKHLRVLDLSRGPYMRGIAIGRSRNGVLAFDYDGRLVRFGDDLELPEAVGILELLQRRVNPIQPSPGAA